MNRFYISLGFLLLMASVATLLACAGSQDSDSDGASVVVTFYPLAYLAQRIGGDRVNVSSLVPPGTEAHDFEPTPQDVVSVQKAKLFVYNGAGLEPWANRIIQELDGESTLVVDASQGQELLTLDEEHAGEEEVHEGDALDPHVWLSPQHYAQQAEAIHHAMVQADPDGAQVYNANLDNLKNDLSGLDEEMRQGLASCQRRTIVTTHTAFGYLANSFELEEIAVAGLEPEVEPSPARMKEVIEEVKSLGATTIFFETLTSPAVAETIARETGAQTMVLNPLEGLTPEEVEAGEDYLTIMRQNLANLRIALACQ